MDDEPDVLGSLTEVLDACDLDRPKTYEQALELISTPMMPPSWTSWASAARKRKRLDRLDAFFEDKFGTDWREKVESEFWKKYFSL